MFHTVLVANRGEIACRIIATCLRMGIRSIAVFSEADAQSLHVQMADEAVCIGPAEAEKSYLNIPAILQAAKATHAQAIHPGYGFLAESEAFAMACAQAQLVFIGPSPDAIATMGDKAAAKRLLEQAGVPLVPGYHGSNQAADYLAKQATEIGFPLLIKAAAGGGGKGMRSVEQADAFNDALLACQREAQHSFANQDVILERYISRPRHIEVQVFADQHGHIVHLFDRDCSVQRRHQKIIEEAPAPALSDDQRQNMYAAAIAAAKAVNYVGAGTIEFLYDTSSGAFFFMEMNTRLQVEHAVTEQITGLDLVEWQLRVAAGEPLPLTQAQITQQGHAFEARIYAEQPEQQFLPSSGQLHQLYFPPHRAFSPAPLRIDSAVREGDIISPHYDPMIAKLIVHGADRSRALSALQNTLEQSYLSGLHSNLLFLQRLSNDDAFAKADIDTGFIDRRYTQLFPDPPKLSPEALVIAAVTRLATLGFRHSTEPSNTDDDPWSSTDGWRLHGRWTQALHFKTGSHTHEVLLRQQDGRWRYEGRPLQWHSDILPHGYHIHLQLAQHHLNVRVFVDSEHYQFNLDAKHYRLDFHNPVAQSHQDTPSGNGDLNAPMPGKIVSIAVAAGDVVKSGQILLVLEAMKMEHAIQSPREGRVGKVFYEVGDQVAEGTELLTIEKA